MKNLLALARVPLVWSGLMTTLMGAELYHLDFTAPETGSYQVISGSPWIAPTAGPLTDALVFPAVAGGVRIQLPVGVPGPGYTLEYDVLLHELTDSAYSFVVYLDDGGVRTLNFHGGLNVVYAYQSSPFLNPVLAPFADDSVYHVGISIDEGADTWSVSINGALACVNPWNGGTLQSVRFGLAPWAAQALDAASTYAALDNVTLSVIPEPASPVLAATGLLILLRRTRAVGRSRSRGSRR